MFIVQIMIKKDSKLNFKFVALSYIIFKSIDLNFKFNLFFINTK